MLDITQSELFEPGTFSSERAGGGGRWYKRKPLRMSAFQSQGSFDGTAILVLNVGAVTVGSSCVNI